MTGGTGQKNKTPDQRVSYDGQGPTTLPPGPYQLTNPNYPYDAYAASPVHRFMQMQQQMDCDASAVTQWNGWGCKSDLYPWVEVTVGAGSNGKARLSPSRPNRPAKARPRWASSTSCRATRRT